MVPILIYPLKLPWDSHLSTFIIVGGRGKKKKGKDIVKTLLVLVNRRMKFIVVTLESNLILEKETISTQ